MCTPGVGLPDQRLSKLPLRAPRWGSGWVLLPVELLRGREEESTDALDVALLLADDVLSDLQEPYDVGRGIIILRVLRCVVLQVGTDQLSL